MRLSSVFYSVVRGFAWGCGLTLAYSLFKRGPVQTAISQGFYAVKGAIGF